MKIGRLINKWISFWSGKSKKKNESAAPSSELNEHQEQFASTAFFVHWFCLCLPLTINLPVLISWFKVMFTCRLVSCESAHDPIIVGHDKPLIIGRGPLTKIKDSRLSREHSNLIQFLFAFYLTIHDLVVLY